MQFTAPLAATALDQAFGAARDRTRRPDRPGDRAGLDWSDARGSRPGSTGPTAWRVTCPDGDDPDLCDGARKRPSWTAGPPLYARRLAAWGLEQRVFRSPAEARGFRDALLASLLSGRAAPAARTLDPTVLVRRHGRSVGVRTGGRPRRASGRRAPRRHRGRRGARRRGPPAGGDGRDRPLRRRGRRLRRRGAQPLARPRRAPGPRGWDRRSADRPGDRPGPRRRGALGAPPRRPRRSHHRFHG